MMVSVMVLMHRMEARLSAKIPTASGEMENRIFIGLI